MIHILYLPSDDHLLSADELHPTIQVAPGVGINKRHGIPASFDLSYGPVAGEPNVAASEAFLIVGHHPQAVAIGLGSHLVAFSVVVALAVQELQPAFFPDLSALV